jgi:hypothetical protein
MTSPRSVRGSLGRLLLSGLSEPRRNLDAFFRLLMALILAALASVAPAAEGPRLIGSLEGGGAADGIRFLVEQDGLYSIDAAFLAKAGLPLPLRTRWIRLLDRFGERPLWIEDGGDGRLDTGSTDRLIFYGFRPRGETSTYPAYNTGAPHWLIVDRQVAWREAKRRAQEAQSGRPDPTPAPERFQRVSAAEARRRFPKAVRYDLHMPIQRFERDDFYATWMGADPDESDFYFYKSVGATVPEAVFEKLWTEKPMDPRPWGERYADASFEPRLTAKLYGVSRAEYADQPDHAADISINGHPLGQAAWEGLTPLEWTQNFGFDFLSQSGAQTVTLTSPDERASLVDEIYIDWLEIALPCSTAYPFGSKDGKKEIFTGAWTASDPAQGFHVVSVHWPATGALLLDPASCRVYEPVAELPNEQDALIRFEWFAGAPDLARAPKRWEPRLVAFLPATIAPLETDTARPWRELPILRDPQALAAGDKGLQNLLVTREQLWAEGKRLAERRQAEGIETLMVDVVDLYDAYSGGLVSPLAIRDFARVLFEASPLAPDADKAPPVKQRTTRAPMLGSERQSEADQQPADESEKTISGLAPRRFRYLTLLGDSTYDYKGIQERYHPERRISSANVLPIFYSDTFQAMRALRSMFPADNNFVAFLDQADTPALAVGRIPAATAEEAQAYLEKVIAYESAAPEDDWIGRTVMVSSWERSFQNLLDQMASQSLGDFENQYLIAELDTYEDDVAKLEGALNDGCGLLYYVGHGGSFVWRVGPVDFQKQKDLFTTENVRALHNEGRYPILLVSSCYTVSFDHVRSLGEEFLLTPKRGAVAALGSPWKTGVSPNHHFNSSVASLLFDAEERAAMFPAPPQPDRIRLGDAFFATKRLPSMSRETKLNFTLLGDPCLRVVVPSPRPKDASADETPKTVAEGNPEEESPDQALDELEGLEFGDAPDDSASSL